MYGARPLKRVIQRSLLNPMSTLILDGSLVDGHVVSVDVDPIDPESLKITCREKLPDEPENHERDLAESSDDDETECNNDN
jgi:hypothetical protein